MNPRDLIPVDKADVERAHAAVAAGFPQVEPILGPLVEWLQDCNWPVAHVLLPFLQSIGQPMVPHIWHVLGTSDLVWKYWVIGGLVPSLPKTAAVAFRAELQRLASGPRPDEAAEELDGQARDALASFGWGPGEPFHCVALAFANALVEGDFARAHSLLSPSLRTRCTPEVLRGELRSMYAAYASGPPTAVRASEGAWAKEWPTKLPGDVGRAYVGIEGTDFLEGVDVVVADVAGRLLIRAVEWGRP